MPQSPTPDTVESIPVLLIYSPPVDEDDALPCPRVRVTVVATIVFELADDEPDGAGVKTV